MVASKTNVTWDGKLKKFEEAELKKGGKRTSMLI